MRYLLEALTAQIGLPGQPKAPVLVYIGLVSLLILPFSPVAAAITGGVGLVGLIATSITPRFRLMVDEKDQGRVAAVRRETLLTALAPDAQQRYRRIEQRCASMAQTTGPGAEDALRLDALKKLCWLHLHLLAGRQRILQAVADVDLTQQPSLHAATTERLTALDGQLKRIEQQLDRLQVESALREDPGGLASRIDAVVWTLDDTGAWLRNHDLMADSIGPPELTSGDRQPS